MTIQCVERIRFIICAIEGNDKANELSQAAMKVVGYHIPHNYTMEGNEKKCTGIEVY